MNNSIKLIVLIALPLLIGFLSSYITADSVSVYSELIKPFLAPPAWIFGYVWTALYIMMGLASYLACIKSDKNCFIFLFKSFYLPQIIINSMWSILFFYLSLRLLSFIWILILIFLVIKNIEHFKKYSKFAAYLLYPYLAWISFAAYLNGALYLLNL